MVGWWMAGCAGEYRNLDNKIRTAAEATPRIVGWGMAGCDKNYHLPGSGSFLPTVVQWSSVYIRFVIVCGVEPGLKLPTCTVFSRTT
jgi:hypothetical protein